MNDDPLAPALQRLGDQLMIMSAAVAGRCVEKINAEIKRSMQGGNRFVIVGWSVHSGHTHTAKTQRRNFELCRAELSIFHMVSWLVDFLASQLAQMNLPCQTSPDSFHRWSATVPSPEKASRTITGPFAATRKLFHVTEEKDESVSC